MKRYLSAILLSVLLLLPACGPEENGGGEENGKTPAKEWTVSGTVKGNDGNPIADVVVSDGISCTRTDAQGNYALAVDLSVDLAATLKYVFVSTPSGWAAPKEEGHAIFWKWLKDYSKNSEGKITGVDFTLTKIANPERFTIFIFGDPQPRKSGYTVYTNGSAFRAVDVCTDMYKDMKELAAKMTSPVYGIGLGDIVHRTPSYLPTYRSGMMGTGITTYNIIGNHDQVADEQGNNPVGLAEEEASKIFEKHMGPTNYSFNLGSLHFLMLDDMVIREGKPSDDCATGLTDDIWEFVKNDLALVPSSASIMLCAHSPMFMQLDGTEQNWHKKYNHLSELKNILKRFERVYAWAGHSHSTFNHYTKDSNIEEHTLCRVTGALWTNEYLSENGTPRGYIVFDYDGGNISWKFKPTFWQTGAHCNAGTDKEPDYTYRDWNYDATGRAILKSTGQPLDDSYQMQLFKPGTYEKNDNTVYANVFLWDEAWKTPTVQLEGSTSRSPMTRVTEGVGKLFRYSFADREMTEFYASKWPGLKTEWYGEDYTGTGYPDKKMKNCASIFKYKVNSTADHGSATVRVTDRFGNEYSSKLTW